MFHGGTRGHRMEDADAALVAEAFIHPVKHAAQIAGELFVVMAVRAGGLVPPMIAHVEEDEFETLQQRFPEDAVTVDCKAVAMADEKTDTLGIAATANV